MSPRSGLLERVRARLGRAAAPAEVEHLRRGFPEPPPQSPRDREATKDLAREVAHDLANHQAAVCWSVELLKPLVQGNQEATDLLTYLDDSVQRCRELASQLAALSGSRANRPVPLDANREIRRQLDLLKRAAGNLELATELGRDLGCVVLDPNEFRRILVGLVASASRALTICWAG